MKKFIQAIRDGFWPTIIVLIVFAAIAGFIALPFIFIYKYKAESEMHDSHLNKRVVIQKDTLTIVDYSMVWEEYTLNNGKTIAFDMYEKTVIK